MHWMHGLWRRRVTTSMMRTTGNVKFGSSEGRNRKGMKNGRQKTIAAATLRPSDREIKPGALIFLNTSAQS
jgi:hypothetical protein